MIAGVTPIAISTSSPDIAILTRMISDVTAAKLAELEQIQDDQLPSEPVRTVLAEKTLICVVGATCMGKSSLMEAVVALEPSISRASTVTSRPRQARDKPGDYRRYYEHSDIGLAPLLEDISSGRVVQYALNPATKHLMATYPEDYPSDINIRDIYATSVAAFEKLGFGKLLVISVVTPYETWKVRLDERFAPNEADEIRDKRLQEAVISLAWSLEHSDQANHHWLTNDATPEAAAQQLLDILAGKKRDETSAQTTAEACLAKIQELLA